MADRKNTPWDAMAERVADLIKHQLNKQNEPDQRQEKLSDALEKLIDQQQKTNEQLRKIQASTEAQTQEFRDWRQTSQQSNSQQFFRKMLMEVPPVVLAVLLAFGINSWWQQHRANLAAAKAYRNIVSEIESNLGMMEIIIRDEERGIKSLEQQIAQLTEGDIDPNKNYGASFNTFPLRDAAWRTAGLSNALSHFEDSLIMDLIWLYEKANAQEEFKQLTLTLDQTLKYSEETLLPYLKVNHSLLRSHVFLTEDTAEAHRRFLEKYGELEAIDNQ